MNNLLNLASTDLSASLILFNIVFAFILSFIISQIYVRTHKGLSYSQSFVFSIVVVGVITSVMMMVIRNSIIGALGLLGVFSFIRFRTIIKETRDIVFIFFSLTVGLAIGIGSYSIALLGTILICLIILLLSRYNFGSTVQSRFIINLLSTEVLDKEKIALIFGDSVKSYSTLHTKKIDHTYEYTLSVIVRGDVTPLVKRISDSPAIQKMDIISGRDVVEY